MSVYIHIYIYTYVTKTVHSTGTHIAPGIIMHQLIPGESLDKNTTHTQLG